MAQNSGCLVAISLILQLNTFSKIWFWKRLRQCNNRISFNQLDLVWQFDQGHVQSENCVHHSAVDMAGKEEREWGNDKQQRATAGGQTHGHHRRLTASIHGVNTPPIESPGHWLMTFYRILQDWENLIFWCIFMTVCWETSVGQNSWKTLKILFINSFLNLLN